MSKWGEIEAFSRPIVEGLEADLSHQQQVNSALSLENDMLRGSIAELEGENADLQARIKELQWGHLKPGLKGLVTTDPDNYTGVPYAEFVSTKPLWKNCNPSQGQYDFAAVDAMLRRHPDKKFRLRFMAGKHAPDWVKAHSGGAVQHVPDTRTGDEGMVPRFWTQQYFDDYMAFMTEVAWRYENNPQVVEIPNSLTTTIYAEPFILNADAATITRYWNAGYRWDMVRTNLMNSMHDMMDLFPTTRISLAGHGKWERIIDGKINRDWPAERAVYIELIDAYGPHLVLDDHGLWTDDAIGVGQPWADATTWYNFMTGCDPTDLTYGWQFTPKDDNMFGAAQMGVAMGARFLEFAGFNRMTEAQRRQIHDALLANAEGKP